MSDVQVNKSTSAGLQSTNKVGVKPTTAAASNAEPNFSLAPDKAPPQVPSSAATANDPAVQPSVADKPVEIEFESIELSRQMSIMAEQFNVDTGGQSQSQVEPEVDISVEQLTFAGIDMEDPQAVLQRAQVIKSVLRTLDADGIDALTRSREVAKIEAEARQALQAEQSQFEVSASDSMALQDSAGEISGDQVLAAIKSAGQITDQTLSADALDTAVQQDTASSTRVVNVEDEAAEEKSQQLALAQNNTANVAFAGRELTIASQPFNELQVSIQRLVGSAQDSNLDPFFTVA